MNKIIQGLWIGNFSVMEQLCIRSFLAHGHEFDLYTYGPVVGVPDGTRIEDANEIVPYERVAKFTEVGGGFSDFFRFSLLAKRGGWWMDMDMVCLRPLDFEEEYVYGGIRGIHTYKGTTGPLLNGCVIKTPAGAPIMKYCRDWYDCHQNAGLEWNTGPHLVQDAVAEFEHRHFIQPVSRFGAVECTKLDKLVDPNFKFDLTDAYAVHLHHGYWNCGHESYGVVQMVDTVYSPRCLYEQLKARYL